MIAPTTTRWPLEIARGVVSSMICEDCNTLGVLALLPRCSPCLPWNPRRCEEPLSLLLWPSRPPLSLSPRAMFTLISLIIPRNVCLRGKPFVFGGDFTLIFLPSPPLPPPPVSPGILDGTRDLHRLPLLTQRPSDTARGRGPHLKVQQRLVCSSESPYLLVHISLGAISHPVLPLPRIPLGAPRCLFLSF